MALAELQQDLGLSPGALGAALAIGLLASLPAMLLGGRLADRWGPPALLQGAAILAACALLAVAGARGYWALVPLMMLFFVATGTFDVAINAAAMRVEHSAGRRVLPLFHAAFSGAAALFALLSGIALSVGLPFRWLYVGSALLVLLFALCSPAGGAGPSAPTAAPAPAGAERRAGLLRSAPVQVLALVTALGFQMEGEAGNWATIYLTSVSDFPAWLGASGLALFHAAMLVGRLGAARALARLSRATILRAAGGVAALGMTLALVAEGPPAILGGFLITGLGVAAIAPVAFSLAGDVAPDRVGEVSALLAVVAYVALLLGPVIVGGLAELLGLRLALGSIVAMGACVALLGRYLDAERPAPAGEVVTWQP